MSSRASASAVPLDAVASADRADADPEAARPAAESARRRWSLQLGLLASVLFWVVAWYWDTAASMAGVWWHSETFAHGMIVYPVSLWLIWRARDQLKDMHPVPAYWALSLLALLSLAWLLGDLAGVQAARHFGLVAMIAVIVWVMMGSRIARVIAFPLGFSLLAVPVGEFLLPILIEQTADFIVGALRLSGIPVFREGNRFLVPSGSWSVVEACSGLRYLIASLTLGLLYAYLSYRSLTRRLLFVLASIVVPIVANWVRAYMIVMIGHLSGMKYAVGIDHLIYGWIFFGLVMMLLFWLGSFWREDDVGAHGTAATDKSGPPVADSSPFKLLAAGVLAAATVTVAPSYSAHLESLDASQPLGTITLPQTVNGWTVAEREANGFNPQYVGARLTAERFYERDSHRVGLYVAYYAQQRESAQLLSMQNAMVVDPDRAWNQVGNRIVSTRGTPPSVIQTELRSSQRDLTIWQMYWINGEWKVDPRLVKVQQALDRLAGRGDDAAVVILHTRSDGTPGSAERRLQAFLQDMSAPIAQALTGARRPRDTAREDGAPDGR